MLSKEWGIAVLRIWFGITILYLGYLDWNENPDILIELLQKIFNSPLYGILESISVPLHLLGGITLLLGIAVRPSSIILSIILIFKFSKIFQFDEITENWDKLTLIVVTASFWFIGPGSMNARNRFLKKNRRRKSE